MEEQEIYNTLSESAVAAAMICERFGFLNEAKENRK